MSFIPPIETQTQQAIQKLQVDKLKELIQYLQKHSPFYQRHFTANKINPGTINSLEDLRSIAPIGKDDLHNNNWDFLCADKTKVIEYTSTSGTLGKPVTIALTEKDLQRLAYNEYISFSCADGTPDDLYQLMLTLDRQFMAGVAYYEGIRQLGAGVIRIGPGVPALQWETIERLKPTAIVAVPSFIVKLIAYAEQQGINYKNSSVKKAICIGEPLRTAEFKLNTLGQRITDAWNIQLYSTYASTEMQTAFTECTHGQGGHLHPELVIAEFLDDNNNPVAEGEPGELVISTLGVEGMPLLRYKTGDVARHYRGACSCGRTTLRIGPIEGRRQQIIKLKGTTLYPTAIFEIITQVKEINDFAVEAFTGALGTDELRVYLVAKTALSKQQQTSVSTYLQSHLRVLPEIKFITSEEMEHMQFGGQLRKPKRFFDRRI